MPLGIALTGITTFIKAIAIAGVVAGGFEGILIVLMHWKAKKLGKRKPEYSIKSNYIIYAVLVALFTFGAVYYLINIL